jgi:NADH:ubiquinone oxidoreductase subunit 3 (subunit A)
MLIGYLLGPNKPDEEKNSQFECGFPAFDDSRMYFNVRYYLVVILFILFDSNNIHRYMLFIIKAYRLYYLMEGS